MMQTYLTIREISHYFHKGGRAKIWEHMYN